MMNIPRLLVGSLAFAYSWKKYGAERIGLHGRGAVISLLVLAALLLALLVDGINPYPMPTRLLLTLAVSSFVVAFNEESLFRALGLEALSDWKGERTALWLSTILFTVFHFRAADVVTWPSIFLTGFLFARMRMAGVSLLLLMFVHGTYDALWFLLEDNRGWLDLFYLPLLVLVVLVGYEALTRKSIARTR